MTVYLLMHAYDYGVLSAWSTREKAKAERQRLIDAARAEMAGWEPPGWANEPIENFLPDLVISEIEVQ